MQKILDLQKLDVEEDAYATPAASAASSVSSCCNSTD
jgi:hypothetical protein